jgi:hypothetical protein
MLKNLSFPQAPVKPGQAPGVGNLSLFFVILACPESIFKNDSEQVGMTGQAGMTGNDEIFHLKMYN